MQERWRLVPGWGASLARRATARVDPLTRGWAVVTGGSVARLALGFVASVLTARALGPSGFGTFAVLAAVGMLAGAGADLGFSAAAVKRIAPVWQADPETARERGRVFLWLRLATALALVVVGGLIATPFAGDLLGAAGDSLLLWLALAGVVATALSGAMNTLLQATSHFGRLSAVLLINSALTVLLAAGLAWTGHLTLETALLVLGIATSLVSFVAGWRLLPGRWRLGFPGRAALRAEGPPLLRFGSWLWVASLCGLLATRLDLLLVNHWVAPASVGAYALALNLSSKVDVVNHSLYTVLMPAASALGSTKATRGYVRQSLIRGAAISLGLAPLILLARPLIGAVYGPGFGPAAGLFQGLLAVAIFEVFATPLLLLPFAADRARLVASADALRVVTLVLVAAWLIPLFGPAGAVLARLVSRVAALALTLAALALRRPATAPGRLDPRRS